MGRGRVIVSGGAGLDTNIKYVRYIEGGSGMEINGHFYDHHSNKIKDVTKLQCPPTPQPQEKKKKSKKKRKHVEDQKPEVKLIICEARHDDSLFVSNTYSLSSLKVLFREQEDMLLEEFRNDQVALMEISRQYNEKIAGLKRLDFKKGLLHVSEDGLIKFQPVYLSDKDILFFNGLDLNFFVFAFEKDRKIFISARSKKKSAKNKNIDFSRMPTVAKYHDSFLEFLNLFTFEELKTVSKYIKGFQSRKSIGAEKYMHV